MIASTPPRYLVGLFNHQPRPLKGASILDHSNASHPVSCWKLQWNSGNLKLEQNANYKIKSLLQWLSTIKPARRNQNDFELDLFKYLNIEYLKAF